MQELRNGNLRQKLQDEASVLDLKIGLSWRLLYHCRLCGHTCMCLSGANTGPIITLHTLRHTFASQLVMAGVSLREVQVLMGHQSYETTLQYAHMSEDHANRQVLKLPFANGSGNSTARIRHAEALSVDSPKK